MINLNKYIYNYFLFLFSIIPLCLIIGSAVSFINILLIDLSFIILLIYKKDFHFFKNNTIIYFFILFIYLIFNSFISIDFSEGILRNLCNFKLTDNKIKIIKINKALALIKSNKNEKIFLFI